MNHLKEFASFVRTNKLEELVYKDLTSLRSFSLPLMTFLKENSLFARTKSIGLAVCKKITENHGGFIVVNSELGVGSTFIISLPSLHEELAQTVVNL